MSLLIKNARHLDAPMAVEAAGNGGNGRVQDGGIQHLHASRSGRQEPFRALWALLDSTLI